MKKLFILGILTAPVFATEFDVNTYEPSLDFAQVTNVVAIQRKTGTWCFDTSVRHHDQGWEHYADRWEVLDLEGNVLGKLKLPVVFPLKDCFCFYLDVFTEN